MNSIAREKEKRCNALAAATPRLGRNQAPVRIRWLVLAVVAIGFSTTSALGQIKYTPDHPEVKAIADRAVAALTKVNRRNLDRATLVALAIVEHGKRYNQQIPKDNPIVVQAIQGIVKDVPLDGELKGILGHRETYFPCLALILLAETDATKYKPQIKALISWLEKRQLPNGSYSYRDQPKTSDMSQTQFSALAMFVAKHHGFNVDVQMAKRTLQWTLGAQVPPGSWVYKYNTSGQPNDPGRPSSGSKPTLSMHTAGCGTAYLLGDLLQLTERAKSMTSKLSRKDIGLPRTVTIYVKPIDGENTNRNQSGPLVQFDRGRLSNATRGGNIWLENNFAVKAKRWTFYYLYALERYAYFREQTEGDMGNGRLKNWYDQVVEHLQSVQQENGIFKGESMESAEIATAFAILVLVRSSEVINMPTSESELAGGRGFEVDKVLHQSNGQLKAIGAEKNLAETLKLMKEDASPAQLEQLANSLKRQVVEFRQKDDKSRGEIKAFLQTMIGARNYFRRLIAVRFLAGEQDMDNVPALLHALGDPDLRICLEAHDGLRLVSRKIDTLVISHKTRTNAARYGILKPEEHVQCRTEFDSIKQKWTDWFLKIRPGAELLD